MALLALGVAVPAAAAAPAAPAPPAAPGRTLQGQFAAVAKEFRVPESILLAVSYQQTRWESHQGRPSTTGNYNVMGLTQVDLAAVAAAQAAAQPETNLRGEDAPRLRTPAPRIAPPVDSPALHTLDAAARLTGRPAAELRTDTLQSIRGGAALLADLQKRAAGTLPTDPAQWYDAVARFSNGGQDPTAGTGGREFADRVFGSIRVGTARTTSEGQQVTLAASPAAVAHSPAVDRGTLPEAASRSSARAALAPGATAECPAALNCDVKPAAYALTDQSDPTSYGNYSVAERGAGDIQYIVIHDTEGGFAGAVGLFQNPATQASAHYIVRSSDGHVSQLVATKDVAWHAANKTVNTHSLGIEHEGFALSGASWYSEQLYQSSAALTRYLAGRYGIPLDRQHVIGHDEVPGPVQSSVAGMHWDPGTFWDWNHYMALMGVWPPSDQAVAVGGRVVVNPPFSNAYRPQINGVTPQPANFVYLYASPGGALIGNGTTNAADWSDKAVAGGSYVVADQQYPWTAIWYNGRKAWFYGAGSIAADNRPGQSVLTPKAGLSSIPVYGRTYPQDAAFTAAGVPLPSPNISPLDATVAAGQAYVPVTADPVAGDYYYTSNINGDAPHDRTTVVDGTRYYPIRYNHRLAFLRAEDVQVVPAATNLVADGERVQLLANTSTGPVAAAANYTRGQWEQYRAIPAPGAGADASGTFAEAFTANDQLHAVALAGGRLYTADRNVATGLWSGWYDLHAAGAAGPLGTVTEVTVAARGNRLHVVALSGGRLYEASGDYTSGTWQQWGDVSGAIGQPAGAMTGIAAATVGNVLHIVALSADGRVMMADGDYDRGRWSYGDVSAQTGPLTGISALAVAPIGSKLHVVALSGGRLSEATADYAGGRWYQWGDISAATGQSGAVTAVAAAATGNSLRLYGVIGGRIHNANGDYTAGRWSGWGDTEGSGAGGAIGPVGTLAAAGR
ncbi:N-acetylmuramoyl-L-alanine amidase [Kitasatospora sp. NPDC088346]|uniref:N-acetylmuramoyl-L-alanine amidase n=1 Tax=Kitasatospora sp. NPDC088346 TaxID=3364073 RepID=UPI00381396B5